ncbi:MAG: phosphatase PAP2 family protein [Chitinophagaceae bacterium]
MKPFRIILYILLFTAVLTSCKKEVIGRTEKIAALQPSNIDINAGTWKTILLTAPDEFAVAAPGGTNTTAYAAEINEIKSWQQNMSIELQNDIQYWGAGAVLRWNEILRGLVAKYNLAPYQNPDGTYPIPDANNPFAATRFPFANPPYAARAYAYVSAAQYDALVAAWHYKKLYNRSAPYKINSTVSAKLPQSDLPSYPSEDAVVIGVTTEMLKLFFPTEQAYIQGLAIAHKNARIAAGVNVRSDLEAGEAFGRLVAQKFAARARTDRAGAAVGIVNGVNLWEEFETGATGRGEVPWISQESPKRPPMLPYFGRVRTWLFDSLTLVTTLRPPAPPSTSSDQFKKETEEVLYYSNNATREQIRIVHFWADGGGTYTPPGHWNAIAADDFLKQNFSEVRWARNLALLNMSLMDAAVACWDAKYTYFNPRPSQTNPAIKTWTGLPNFPSYTSGHSTFSGAAASILSHILPARKQAYEAMAKEASLSRLYGAIHYRSDCDQGLICGNRVGTFAVNRARTDGAD